MNTNIEHKYSTRSIEAPKELTSVNGGGKNTKKRLPNFEVMRVFAMLSIVMFHALTHGSHDYGIEEQYLHFSSEKLGVFNFMVSEALLAFVSMAVDLYVLTTGYFLCTSTRMQWKKILVIWLQVFVYSLLICVAFNGVSDLTALKQALLPIKYNTYWFATQYLALLALSPFLAVIVNSLKKQAYIVLLAVMYLMQLDLFGLPYGFLWGDGYGGKLWLFVALFFTGGYIRKFSLGRLSSTIFSARVFWGTFLSVLLFYTVRDLFPVLTSGEPFHQRIGSSPNHSFSFILATLFFIHVKSIELKESRLIRILVSIAPYTFGVYLLHDNPYMRRLLWFQDFDETLFCNEAYFLPVITAYTLAIFAVGILVDKLRALLFRLMRVNTLAAWLCQRLPQAV